MTRPPDLILIMTDQQRHDQIGYAGVTPVETPHLDALAGNGVIFENAYSAATTCVPARSSLMTGLHDQRVRYQAPRALHEGSWTVPRALRSAGYQTALIGKMHFSPIRASHGFDHLRLCEHLNAYTQDPRHLGQLDHYHDWLQDRGLADWRFETEDAMGSGYRYPTHTHPTEWVRDETLAFLEQRDRSRPLLLVVSFPHPHPPVNPPEPYATRYDPAACVIDPGWASHNQYLPHSLRTEMAQADAPHRRIDPARLEAHQASLARTYGLITQIDDAVGTIVDQLPLDESLVFFTADHGDFAGHRGLVRKIPWIPFDDLAKVPCFAVGGMVQGGRIELAPMQSFDSSVTFLAAAGIDVDYSMLDGVDLTGYLADPAATLATGRSVACSIKDRWPMVRSGPHKLIRDRLFGSRVLFDVDRDPEEQWNVLSLDVDGEITGSLEAEMDRQCAGTVPDLPVLDRS